MKLTGDLIEVDAVCDRIAAKRRGYCPHTPTEKQKLFLSMDNEIEVMFGGAGGGGKSDALLMAALKYVHVPGYSALILRRTFKDLNLSGAIMDRAHDWLKGTDAKWNALDHRYRFPSGASLTFGHLHHEADKTNYKSAEFQFCHEVGTLIRMADNSLKAVEDISVGDSVQTLEGPRHVTQTRAPVLRECVRVVGENFETVVSEGHVFLTPHGWAAVPRVHAPIQCCESSGILEASTATHSKSFPPSQCSLSGPSQALQGSRRIQGESLRRGIYASKEGGRTYCEVSGDYIQGVRPLVAWSGQLVRASLVLPSEGEARAHHVRSCASAREMIESSIQGSKFGCHSVHDCDGGPLHAEKEAGLERLPSQDDAEGQCPPSFGTGDPERILQHNLERLRWYRHPYTNKDRFSVLPVDLFSVETFPAGERYVVDLTVEGASHYILHNGIVSSNCGFDELTEFPELWYTFLFTRLRKTKDIDVPLRMRSATNPGGIGHVWVYDRFVNEKTRQAPFVPSFLSDNPHIDDTYLEALDKTDQLTRDQVKHGLWNIDSSLLVYNINPERNFIHSPVKCTIHILGIDYGATNDSCSFTVVGLSPGSPVVTILKSYKKKNMAPGDAAEEAQRLDREYHFARIVGDANGLGKGYMLEARRRFGIPVEDADKNNKAGYIKLFNGDLEKGLIKIVEPDCTDLVKESIGLVWSDASRSKEMPNLHNDCLDGGLYAWRLSHQYLRQKAETSFVPIRSTMQKW